MQGLTDQGEERGLLQGRTEELHLRWQDLPVSVPLWLYAPPLLWEPRTVVCVPVPMQSQQGRICLSAEGIVTSPAIVGDQ